MTRQRLQLSIVAVLVANCTSLLAQAGKEITLRETVERFIAVADKGDTKTVAAMYDPAFTNVRVADDGVVVKLKPR